MKGIRWRRFESALFFDLTFVVRKRRFIAGSGARPNVQRRQRFILYDLDQTLLGQLQQRHKRDDDTGTPLFQREQRFERRELFR
ncbi:hypothetical protein ZBT109_1737 [Zymobacter palmae]|uniref:Uncharacterized protein n=1 Tax=Zymobacter palmae TaxID=33074 RepID=A0A348HFT5_9GAMM|nr:hypothetical protein ZBT109_1737 [Zymobacter palmae]